MYMISSWKWVDAMAKQAWIWWWTILPLPHSNHLRTRAARVLVVSISYSNYWAVFKLFASFLTLDSTKGIKTHRKINIAHLNVGSFFSMCCWFFSSPFSLSSIIFANIHENKNNHIQMTFGSCLSFSNPKNSWDFFSLYILYLWHSKPIKRNIYKN